MVHTTESSTPKTSDTSLFTVIDVLVETWRIHTVDLHMCGAKAVNKFQYSHGLLMYPPEYIITLSAAIFLFFCWLVDAENALRTQIFLFPKPSAAGAFFVTLAPKGEGIRSPPIIFETGQNLCVRFSPNGRASKLDFDDVQLMTVFEQERLNRKLRWQP